MERQPIRSDCTCAVEPPKERHAALEKTPSCRSHAVRSSDLPAHRLRAHRALRALGIAAVLVFGSMATAQDHPTVGDQPIVHPRGGRIRERQFNARIPAAGTLSINLEDGSHASLSIMVYSYLNGPLDQSFLDDPDALDLVIQEVLGALMCETLDTQEVTRQLQIRIRTLMVHPEHLSHARIEVTSCESLDGDADLCVPDH